jgi:hypothetical protein
MPSGQVRPKEQSNEQTLALLPLNGAHSISALTPVMSNSQSPLVSHSSVQNE